MNRWNQYRLVDIFSKVDMSLLEEEFLNQDLEKKELAAGEPKAKSSMRQIAIWSGVAAGSLALTGAAVLLFRRYDVLKKAVGRAA